MAGTQVRGVGAERHVFLTTGRNNRCIAKLNMLCTEGNRAKAGPTNLIDAPSGGLNRKAPSDMGLTGGGVTLRRGPNLAKAGFAHVTVVNSGAGYTFWEDRSAKSVGGRIGESSAKAANSSSCGRGDNNVSHSGLPIETFSQFVQGPRSIETGLLRPLSTGMS
jgi:hypothetical protein